MPSSLLGSSHRGPGSCNREEPTVSLTWPEANRYRLKQSRILKSKMARGKWCNSREVRSQIPKATAEDQGWEQTGAIHGRQEVKPSRHQNGRKEQKFSQAASSLVKHCWGWRSGFKTSEGLHWAWWRGWAGLSWLEWLTCQIFKYIYF